MHQEILDRFTERCVPVTESGCWIWIGSLNTGGYGSIRIAGRMKTAHRLSWEIHNGPIPPGDHQGATSVCHTCDEPSCVNPDHLFLGSHKQNMRDMARKKRGFRPIGELHPRSKLTEAEVLAIRKSPGLHKDIAAVFNVSRTTVGRIKSDERWSHL